MRAINNIIKKIEKKNGTLNKHLKTIITDVLKDMFVEVGTQRYLPEELLKVVSNLDYYTKCEREIALKQIAYSIRKRKDIFLKDENILQNGNKELTFKVTYVKHGESCED